ncbi:MAG: arginine repressor [Wujia sp.]
MKKQRQKAIVKIINENIVETQEELLALLRASGFDATQATISRDIRELAITKVNYDGSRKRYAVGFQDNEKTDSYRQVLSSCISSVDSAENIIVVKTVSGMAMAVGAALDAMNIDGIVGCIAGDDTLFLAIRHRSMVDRIIGDIRNVTKHAY